MTDFWLKLFDPNGFVPRSRCGGAWTDGLIALHNVSDGLIWLAYLAIPLVLVTLVRRRKDIPFSWMFLMFGLFIVSCGFTHFMEVVMFYDPVYRLEGVVKLVTAVASWATVVGLVPVMGKALTLRSPKELEREVVERRKAEDALQRANAELESQVQKRTQELLEANRALQQEVEVRRRAEEQLRQRAAELAEADRNKDEFLAMLAHELRNPLAPIRNALQILKTADPSDGRMRWSRDVMDRQVGHMARLVDDLLDVARIRGGLIALQRESVDLAAVLERAVETVRPSLDAHRHELVVTPPTPPLSLTADPTRLAQVFSNLLHNAAKYTRDGGRIELTAGREGGEVVVRVRDNGRGIGASLLPRVFDLFTQGDRSLARTEGGLGIGLTLVRSLVESHGGTVEARSEGDGRGSEFVVRLPAGDPGGPIAEQPAGDSRGESPTLPAAGRRVLVVDDNRDGAETLALLLRSGGHEVRTAHDGPEALAAARAFRPQIVFLDIGLPGMDGYEVARRLRKEPGMEKGVLVALTGYGREEDRRQALEAGFDLHLVKPADADAIQEVVAKA